MQNGTQLMFWSMISQTFPLGNPLYSSKYFHDPGYRGTNKRGIRIKTFADNES